MPLLMPLPKPRVWPAAGGLLASTAKIPLNTRKMNDAAGWALAHVCLYLGAGGPQPTLLSADENARDRMK